MSKLKLHNYVFNLSLYSYFQFILLSSSFRFVNRYKPSTIQSRTNQCFCLSHCFVFIAYIWIWYETQRCLIENNFASLSLLFIHASYFSLFSFSVDDTRFSIECLRLSLRLFPISSSSCSIQLLRENFLETFLAASSASRLQNPTVSKTWRNHVRKLPKRKTFELIYKPTLFAIERCHFQIILQFVHTTGEQGGRIFPLIMLKAPELSTI